MITLFLPTPEADITQSQAAFVCPFEIKTSDKIYVEVKKN
jgi:hypothetical protein